MPASTMNRPAGFTVEVGMQQPPQWVIDEATKAAQKAWCAKDSRGVVAWVPGTRDFVAAANGPPEPFKCSGLADCRAACGKLAGHAEERALWAYARKYGIPTELSRFSPELVHVRVVGDKAVTSGPPSCITCSRTVLMAGAAAIWLWHDDGWRRYEPVEFHTLSLLHEKHQLPVIR
jgi:hypothetical protein